MDSNEIRNQTKSAKINNALGMFIVFFGAVIVIATFFTDSFIGQMTNLVAGVILLAIGGGMMLKSKITLKKLNSEEQAG